MPVDREQIAGFKQAYANLFDQIAHPDGGNYPRLRQLVWQAVESRSGELTKQQQSQALSLLTYTLLASAVACAAAAALPSDDIGGEAQLRLDRAGWSLGLFFALSMTHPEQVAATTALDVLGAEAMSDLCSVPAPRVSDARFWGEFRVVGDALYGRLFPQSAMPVAQTDHLLYALGTGMGLCSREEIRLRIRLVRALVSRAFAAPEH